jgi:hydrogenase expression/formation protein HypD
MRYIDEYRDPSLAEGVIRYIKRLSTRPARFMEFCGGHTVAILKYGLRQLLPPTITMLSGPGCPVCVTAHGDIDKAMALAKVPGVIIATFGDMVRVPGSQGSLQEAKAEGADVRVVYSTMDALEIAKNNPERKVVFLAIGFETTAPTVALSILGAQGEGIRNYYVLSLHKLTPRVMKALLDSGEVKLDGIIGPGHVTTVIGSKAWEFLPREYGMPCAVSGFEPLDILRAVAMLVEQVEGGRAEVGNAYPRSVRPQGNTVAQEQIYKVFEVAEAEWRGMGPIPESGLRLKEEYGEFDAAVLLERYHIDPGPTVEPKGCICGEVLRGVKAPLNCPLFRRACAPSHPVGPCMVSSEGACAAYYHYGGGDEG